MFDKRLLVDFKGHTEKKKKRKGKERKGRILKAR